MVRGSGRRSKLRTGPPRGGHRQNRDVVTQVSVDDPQNPSPTFPLPLVTGDGNYSAAFGVLAPASLRYLCADSTLRPSRRRGSTGGGSGPPRGALSRTVTDGARDGRTPGPDPTTDPIEPQWVGRGVPVRPQLGPRLIPPDSCHRPRKTQESGVSGESDQLGRGRWWMRKGYLYTRNKWNS